ncbi:aminotransferase class III-fold pyridoxal phosphate-dependent enzyme, partial [Bacillus velezensis]
PTFGGNPAACALALKNLQLMEDENLIARSRELGERLLRELEPLREHPAVGDVRGKGLLAGIELVKDKVTKEPADAALVQHVITACREKGLLVGKNGDTVAGYNNVIQLSPPFCLSDEELSFIISTVKESVLSIDF